jgi:hypothetical protein
MKKADSLLEPGGFLQWYEPLPDTGGAPHPACDKLVKTWKKPTAHSSYG